MPKNTKSVKLTEEMMQQNIEGAMEVQPDPSAIPDLDDLLEKIQNLLKDVEEQITPNLSPEQKENVETKICVKYNTQIPIKIINLMLEEQRYDNLDKLLDMFDRLKDVQKGKADIVQAQQSFGEKLNEQYVYPKFGGKEGFEKKMAEKKNE